jgi:hypothetical protein
MPKHIPKVESVSCEIGKLLALDTSSPGAIRVVVSNARGKTVAITRELLFEVDAQQELYPDVKKPVT